MISSFVSLHLLPSTIFSFPVKSSSSSTSLLHLHIYAPLPQKEPVAKMKMCLQAAASLNPCAEEWRPSSSSSLMPISTTLQPPPFLMPFLNPFTRNYPGIIYYYYYYHPIIASVLVPNLDPKVVVESERELFIPTGKSSSRSRMRSLGIPKSGNEAGFCSRSPRFNTTLFLIFFAYNKCRRDFMLTFLDHYCNEYGLEYDFLYLPMDFRQKDNLGYAFINFTTPAAAQKFKTIMQNFKWETATHIGPFRSKKVCEITWARIQGKDRLVRRFQCSNFACNEPGFLPVLLDPPRNGSDPEPAEPIIIGGLRSLSR